MIDCIEFSEELRRVDVADELSFLAMECERLGAADVGRQVMECYSQASGDRPSAQILSFYKAYRACVRAKVSALRAGQLAATGQSPLRDEADRYLQLAARYADELGPPSIMVVGGLMGTGKSTLACALAAALEAELVSTDAIPPRNPGGQSTPSDVWRRPCTRRKQETRSTTRCFGERKGCGGRPVGRAGRDIPQTGTARSCGRRGATYRCERGLCPLPLSGRRGPDPDRHTVGQRRFAFRSPPRTAGDAEAGGRTSRAWFVPRSVSAADRGHHTECGGADGTDLRMAPRQQSAGKRHKPALGIKVSRGKLADRASRSSTARASERGLVGLRADAAGISGVAALPAACARV